jgi:hypothetical protein
MIKIPSALRTQFDTLLIKKRIPKRYHYDHKKSKGTSFSLAGFSLRFYEATTMLNSSFDFLAIINRL